MNGLKNDFDPALAAITALTAAFSGLEVLVFCAAVSFHVPYPQDAGLADIFFHYRKGMVPERELLLYGCGIAASVIAFMVLLLVLRPGRGRSMVRPLRRYLVILAVMVVLELCAAARLVFVPQDAAAWNVLYAVCGVSLLTKTFFSEINQWFGRTL